MKSIKIAAVVFIMMAFIVPSMAASAGSCGETVSRNTTELLQAVDYANDAVIGQLLTPARYSWTDISNKKVEISRRDGKNYMEITDEQAKMELNKDNIKAMSFEEAFARVQEEIGTIIQRVVDSTANAESKGADFFISKIQQNKEKLLLGLTYLERLYNFDMGGHNIKEVLLYEPGTYGVQTNVLDWLIEIGSAGGDNLKIANNVNLFGWGKLFSKVTSSMTLDAFLEENRKKWMPDTSLNEWFLQESRAYILEKMSDWDSRNTGIYRRLYDDVASRAHILPLLTVSEDSVYVIANSLTITYGIVDCYIDRNLRKTDPVRYGELREKFRQQVEQGAKQQKAFVDFWHRIAKPEKKGLLEGNRFVLDSLRIDPDTTIKWSDKVGENAARGVREFFTPLNLYGTYMFVDGVAEGTRIRHYTSKALTERGLSTYAHELTHMFVSELMLNGNGSRDGMMAEVYPRGMFEPYETNDPPAFNLNLIYDRLASSDRYHNAQPERFQDETDLQNYTRGILDVIYTLDYAEADVMFTKSAEEKKKWFHKLDQIEDSETRYNQGEEGSRHNLDSVRELTLDEAEGLNTIDDLICNSIIVSRHEVNGTNTTGTMARNGYYVVPLFSANYAGIQNNYGVSGDLTIRRNAFELLGEYGYYNGMVPYISNQYKESAKSDQTILSDKYILGKIFGGTYETMADFKKAMFQRRIEKTSELNPITITWKNQSVTINNFEELRLLMKNAVESDLVNVNVTESGSNNIRAQATEVEGLKKEVFKAYLSQTQDFKESIYDDGSKPDPDPEPDPDIETAKSELDEAIGAAERKDLTAYTDASAGAFRTAVEAAKGVLQKPDAALEELREAKQSISDAERELVLKNPSVDPEPDPEPEPGKPDPTPVPGKPNPGKPDPTPAPGKPNSGKPDPTPAPVNPNSVKPIFQNGAEEKSGNGRYKVVSSENKTAKLVSVINNKKATLNIPATVKIAGITCKVTEVGAGVMKGNTKLRKVVLGTNVTTIGKQAFMGCKNLKSVQMKGKALKSIKPGAFKKTSGELAVSAKKMNKRQKAKLLKQLKKAGAGKKAKIK